MSPIITDAPASARASAIAAPKPRAPPVTSARLPVRSTAVIAAPSPVTTCAPHAGRHRRSHDAGHNVGTSGQVSRILRSTVQEFSYARSSGRRYGRGSVGRDGLVTKADVRTRGTARRSAAPAPVVESNRGADLSPAGRQVLPAPRRTRRGRAADAVRTRLRPHQPARDRAELDLLPRRAALLLQRQGRPDHPLRQALQGDLRAALRPDRRRRDDRRRAGRGLRVRTRGHRRARTQPCTDSGTTCAHSRCSKRRSVTTFSRSTTACSA